MSAEENICGNMQNSITLDACLEVGCAVTDVSSTVVEFLPDIKPLAACKPLSCLDFRMSQRDNHGLHSHGGSFVSNEASCFPSIRLICQSCGTGCLGVDELERHAELHSGQVTYGCKICKTRYPESLRLVMHMGQHTQGCHLCSACGCLFKTHRSLAEHSVRHTVREQTCGICDETLNSVEELQAHILSAADSARNVDTNIADDNSHSFSGQSVLAVSLSYNGQIVTSSGNAAENYTVSDGQSVIEVMSSAIPNAHACTICHETFTSHEALFRHSLVHPLIHITEFGLPSCGICKLVFQNAAKLHEHVQQSAGVGTLEGPGVKERSSEANLPGSLILAVLRNAMNVKLEEENGDVSAFPGATERVFADSMATDLKVECEQILSKGKKIVNKNTGVKKEKSTDCDSALIPLHCVHG